MYREKRDKIVSKTVIENFGSVEEFDDATNRRKVTLVKTLAGTHDYIGVQEGLQDVIIRRLLSDKID
jgi:abhydrolase domain-containing protein 12